MNPNNNIANNPGNPQNDHQNPRDEPNADPFDEDVVICKLDGKEYKIYSVATRRQTSYPSAFFNKGLDSVPTGRQITYPSAFFNMRVKPRITIQFSDKGLEDVRKAVYKSISVKKPKLDVCMAYLVKILERISVHNDKGLWKSYGIVIAQPDAMVSPLCMIDVNSQPGGILDVIENTPKDLDKWMPLFLCSLYRIGRATYTEYKEQLINALKARPELQAIGEQLNILAIEPNIRSWQNDRNYAGLMAAIDMFFYRYPTHDMAKLRFGTIASRFKDCGALISWQHLHEVSRVEKGAKLCQYVFTKDVTENLQRILKDGEELWEEYSYFPYQVDLNLVSRSAYSATMNRNLYYWCSVICSLIGSPRSRNVRFLLEKDIVSTRVCALWIGYILATKVHAQIAVEGIGDIDDNMEDPNEKMPVQGTPIEWFQYINARNFEFPDKVKRFFSHKRPGFAGSRPGTIGEHLYSVLREVGEDI